MLLIPHLATSDKLTSPLSQAISLSGVLNPHSSIPHFPSSHQVSSLGIASAQEALSSTDELGVPLLLLTPLLVYFIAEGEPQETRNPVTVIHEMREIMEATLSRIVTRGEMTQHKKCLEQSAETVLVEALIECLVSS